MDDVAAARDWMVAQGIARPDGVFATGWSYGGYLTLLALGMRPDLWAGGMAGIAIADWTLMYEDQAETLRQYQVGLFGGTPAEKPEAHTKSSPITYAERVEAPLLVIQGSNDTRCPARQLRAYEEKRDALSMRMFNESAALAAYRWDSAEASARMRVISEAVREECAYLESLPAWGQHVFSAA